MEPSADPTTAGPPPPAAPLAAAASPSKVPTPETRAIFVGNFEHDAKTADLERLFSQHGPVARVDLKRGFAFVFMVDDAHGAAAIRALDGTPLDPSRRRPLKVEWARGDGAIKRREDERRRRSTDPSETLFVVNFDPASTTRHHLDSCFAPYGPIIRLDLQQRFAFIQFEHVHHATAALNALNGAQLGDRYLIVEYTIRGGGAGGTPRSRRRERSAYSYDGPPRTMAPFPSYRGSRGLDRPWGPPYPSRDRSYSPRRRDRAPPDPWRGAVDFRARNMDREYRRDADGPRYRSSSPGRGRRRSRSRDRDRRGTRSLSRERTAKRTFEPNGAVRSRSRSRSPAGSPKPKRKRDRSHSRSRSPGKQAGSRSPAGSAKRDANDKEGDTNMRERSVSRSPRRERSRSRGRSPARKRARSRSRSRNPVQRRSASRSPVRRRSRSRSPVRSHSRSRSRSPMRARDRSRSPARGRQRSRSPVRGRRKSRSRSRDRSASPRSKAAGQGYTGHVESRRSPARDDGGSMGADDMEEGDNRDAPREKMDESRRTPSPVTYDEPIGV